MNQNTVCRGVILVDNDVCAEEAEVLAESGFSVVYVDSLQEATEALYSRASKFHTPTPEQPQLTGSDDFYRMVADFAYDWEYWIGNDGRFLYVSPSCERVTGYNPRAFVDDSHLFLRIIHPEDRHAVKEHLRRDLGSDNVVSMEFRITRSSGEVRWISHSCQAIYNSAGQHMGRRASNRDITDAKQVDEALRDSEQRFRMVFENAATGIVTADIGSGRILTSNSAFERMLGHEPGKIIGKTLADITHPDDIDADLEYFAQLVEGKIQGFQMDKRYIRSDGSVVWGHLVGSLVRDADGGPLYGIGLVDDITEHKQAVELLRRYQVLSESSRDMILFIAPDGRIIEANAAAVSTYGYTREELLGLTIFDLRAPETLPQTAEQMITADSSGVMFETVHCKKDGSRFYVEVSSHGADLDGNRVLLSIIRDITDRKRSEAAREENISRANALARVSMDILSEKTMAGLLQRVADSARELTGARISVSGHKYTGGKFEVGAVSRSEDAPPCVENQEFAVKQGGPCLKMIELESSMLITEEQCAASCGSWGLPAGHYPLQGLVGASLMGLDGHTRGFIMVTDKVEGGFVAEDEIAVRQLAATASLGLQHIEARAEAERHSAELEGFVSSMADGVILFDNELRVVLVNETTRKLLNPPPDVPKEVWLKAYELRTLDDQPVRIEDYPSRRALRGLDSIDARFRMVSPWHVSLVSISGSPVRDALGRVIGGSISFRDISDIVEFERRQEAIYEREHHIVQMLQQALVPVEIPKRIGNIRIGVRYQPALKEAEVGGDFYDVFDLGNGKVGLLIGDVAGKGLMAAIRVAAARYSIRSYAYIDQNPANVLMLANESLCKDSDEEHGMLTAFFAVVDTISGRITYSIAGHEPPVISRASGKIEELSVGGLPLGVLSSIRYTERDIELAPGDAMVLVTDGITEARSENSELFEKAGIIDYLAQHVEAAPEEMANGLLDAANTYASGHLQDDAAIIALDLIR